MRAVDTNVIVRYLMRDDPEQTKKAQEVIGRELVFVPRTVILEVEWVLRGVYGMAIERIIPALRALAGLPRMSIEDGPMVAKAMDWAEAGLDFADALHLAATGECKEFITFDKKLAQRSLKLSNKPTTML